MALPWFTWFMRLLACLADMLGVERWWPKVSGVECHSIQISKAYIGATAMAYSAYLTRGGNVEYRSCYEPGARLRLWILQ